MTQLGNHITIFYFLFFIFLYYIDVSNNKKDNKITKTKDITIIRRRTDHEIINYLYSYLFRGLKKEKKTIEINYLDTIIRAFFTYPRFVSINGKQGSMDITKVIVNSNIVNRRHRIYVIKVEKSFNSNENERIKENK
jgi:hypothetical protein